MAQRYIKIRYAIRFFPFLYTYNVSIKFILTINPFSDARYTGYYEDDVRVFLVVV